MIASRPSMPATFGLLAGVVTLLVGTAVRSVADARTGEALGPEPVTVTIDVEHSRFLPDRLTVRAGTVVSFVVDNHDPIHHELVLGDAEVHRAHERGSELLHPPVPGEVSVGPNASGLTFYRFTGPGTVAFACHLPGHVEYGMVGEVTVVP